jgi:MFS family permease
MLAQMKDGWSYVTGYLPVRNILLMFAVSSLMGSSYMVLLPVFAQQVLHGGPHTLGWLSVASGTGALIAAFSMAARKSVVGLLRMIEIASAMFGVGLILFGLSHWLVLSLVAMLIAGFGMMQGLAASNTIIQTLVPEEKRGRVMSFYTMSFIGMMPFGALVAGALAARLGAPHTLLVTGSFVLLASLWFTLQAKAVRGQMRPRYEELGILQPKV